MKALCKYKGRCVGRPDCKHPPVNFLPAASFWPRNSKLAMRKMHVGETDIYFSATWEMYFTPFVVTYWQHLPKH